MIAPAAVFITGCGSSISPIISTSTTGTVTVLTADPASIAATGSTTLSATVTNSAGSSFVAPTGTVTINGNAGAAIGTITLTENSNNISASGTLTVNGAALATGSNVLTAVFAGDTFHVTSTSNPVTVTVGSTTTPTTGVSTGTLATASPSTVSPTGTTTLTAIIVAGGGTTAPTGDVSFVDATNGLTLGTAVLVAPSSGTNSTAAIQISGALLASGANTILAEYEGVSGTYNASADSFVVTQSPTGTTSTGTTASSANIDSSSATVAPGGTVTLTATIGQTSTTSTTVPTGEVSFIDLSNSSKVIATATLSSSGSGGTSTASVSVNASSLVSGANVIVVTYAGDSNFAGTSSASTTVTLTGGTTGGTTATTTMLTVTPTTVTSTGMISLIATISQANSSSSTYPTGTVQFIDTSDSRKVIATATTSSETFGAAEANTTISAASLPTGTNTIIASYVGDANYTASSSASTTITVSGNTTTGTTATTTALSVSPESVSSTATVSFAAVVSQTNTAAATDPTGTVNFIDTSNGNAIIATSVVSNGNAGTGTADAYATVNASVLASGVNTIVAQYLGDSTFSQSTSAGETVTVSGSTTPTGDATVVTFTLNPANVSYGSYTTLNIVITGTKTNTPEAPSGAVTIYVNGAAVGTAGIGGYGGVSNSSYSIDSNAGSPLGGAGAYSVYVTYPGDSNYAPSTSTTQTVTVSGQKATPSLALSIPSTASSTVTFGTCGAVTATVTELATPNAAVPTGSVEFYTNGSTALGSGNLNGSATADTATFQICTGSGSTINMKGTYTISATYQGDGNYAEAPSSTDVVLTVQ